MGDNVCVQTNLAARHLRSEDRPLELFQFFSKFNLYIKNNFSAKKNHRGTVGIRDNEENNIEIIYVQPQQIECFEQQI